MPQAKRTRPAGLGQGAALRQACYIIGPMPRGLRVAARFNPKAPAAQRYSIGAGPAARTGRSWDAVLAELRAARAALRNPPPTPAMPEIATNG